MRKYLEEEYGIEVTSEKIFRFINTITQNLDSDYVSPDSEDTKAAAAILFELAQAGKYGDSWDPYKKRIGVRKLRENKFDPMYVTLDSPAFRIVFSLVIGEVSYSEAKKLFAEQVEPASERQIENWIAAIRPNAEITAKSFPMMRKKMEAAAKKQG